MEIFEFEIPKNVRFSNSKVFTLACRFKLIDRPQKKKLSLFPQLTCRKVSLQSNNREMERNGTNAKCLRIPEWIDSQQNKGGFKYRETVSFCLYSILPHPSSHSDKARGSI